MGLTNSKDFLSGKYITAVIIDKGNRSFSVPIKNVIDDYFMATISKQRYVFMFEGQRIITWRHTGRKTMRYILYTTDHYKPLSPQHNKELEMILKDNHLPLVDNKLLALFDLLGKREKAEKDKAFEDHDLEKVLEIVAKDADFPEVEENLRNFFERLDAKTIITPVKAISEFLTAELKTTDAKIFGDLEGQVKRTEKEQRAMSNTVVDAKKPWLIIAILGLVVVGLAVLGLWMYSSGGLNGIIPQLPGSTVPGAVQGTLTTQQVMAKYPTPEALKSAIDNGTLKISQLNAESKKFLDSYKPQIAAVPLTGSH